jgi:site-specific recombinase XerD
MPRPKFEAHKDGPRRYRVEIPKSLSSDHPPRRRRHFFSTLEQAEAFLRSFKAQLRDLGTSVRLLRPIDTIDANEAIQLLKRHAIKHEIRRPKLRDIADEWIERWFDRHRSVSLAKHQQSLRYTKERLKRLHTIKVSNLRKDEIEDALWKLPPASFNAHVRRIRSVLAFGMKHGYLATNPALLVETIKRPRVDVKVLPVETVELMLRTAQTNAPDLLPFLCISLFAGVRVEEQFRLLWSDFNLEDRLLRIRPEVSKTNRARTVNLSENLIQWLGSFRRIPTRRVIVGFNPKTLTVARGKLWELMRQAQPTLPKHAPHNALRHCYVSNYLVMHGSIDSLLLQSGHSRAVMFEHYLNIVPKAEAERYWNLRP